MADAYAALRAADRCAECPTLEAALASPVARALVRLQARLAAQGGTTAPRLWQRPAVQPPEPEPFLDEPAALPMYRAKPRKRPATARQPATPSIDRKRLASGDRDDL
jgi:hypothetical protein